ncbi:glycoside hydrolase family 2 TIM barrel-domain containing protein [Bifidobacterium pseudocatenulatum]|uniref:glycoside hydrolase family 2 TIM barrel-domain containing protein n=1 Tax=Bifidobacterium pseudocatenulatum TaxID=28026 RepID=UPI0022E6C785|nr:glycoside hydrolase family 2 TIM barrel-domain containing protein [Bifidobacterium pseudocatenulatum]
MAAQEAAQSQQTQGVPESRILQARQANASWLTDPTVFAVNRKPAHSNHRYFLGEATEPKQNLDGVWKVNVTQAASIDVENAPFAAADFNDAGFGAINVPEHLQMAGYLKNKYVNVQYPWDGHEDPQEPNVPENNHVAIYRRSFTLDRPLAATLENGGTVSITFHGMATAIYVWVNGTFVGYGEDGFTPNEFDITEALNVDGDNVLTVACYEYASASWLEDQDFWRLHGLFRSVELAAQPRVHVETVQIEADYNPSMAAGTLNATLQLRNANDAATVKAKLRDANGTVVWESTQCANETITLNSGALKNIAPWSAEEPTLYELTVLVVGHDGPLVEKIVQRIGFRTFRIEDGIMKLNGKRVVFKGADRHEFDAKRGRSITRQDMIADIPFCKRHNTNAIRTWHYPNQEYWYDLCDEYGIYLIDETNMETHGSWVANNIETPETAVPGSKPQWEGACVDRINSMMRRDYNHPSVLIWSLGNESFAGEVFRAMHAHAHAIDPNRPVHYEGVTHNRKYDDVTDIETRMYAHADEIEEYLKSDPKKPYISCEYMHAMGNSVGNMDEYVALERYPQYQGGFIWDFIDQAILDGNGRMCYGGDFGDRPSDYEFSGDGLLFADRTPSPKAQDVKQLYANVHMTVDASGITITNDNLFVSTADSTFVLRILADGKPVWSSSRRFDVAAGASEHVEIDWPVDDYRASAQELVLEASQQLTSACDWAPAGYELSFGQCVVAGGKNVSAGDAVNTTSDGAITLGRWNIGARSAGREALFSLAQGGMVSYKLGEREFVLRKPLITTFRALTDNDRGAGHAFERAQWAVAGKYARCVDTKVEPLGETAVSVTYTYELAIAQRTKVTIRYVADVLGHVDLHVAYPGEKDGDLPTIPAFGIEWMLPVEYSNLRFYGVGPEETYADRKHAKLGIWDTNAFRDRAPYLLPQETGNHEDVRWAEITDDSGHGLRVSQTANTETGVTKPFAMSLLPYSSTMLEEALHQDELPEPKHMFLRVLAAQMGVGGDDSWMSPVHEQYQLPADQPLNLDVALDLF